MRFDDLFWGGYSKTYDGLLTFPPYRELMERSKKTLTESHLGRHVLDAGTGTGNFALELGKEDFEVVGIDSSDAMLLRAEMKRKKARLGNVHFEKTDLNSELPFPDNSFDHILSVHTLYTLRDPSLTLQEFYRVLKNPGQLTLSEFRHPIQILPVIKEGIQKYGFLHTLSIAPLLLLIAPFNIVLKMRQQGGMYHYWSETSLRVQLEQAGFRVANVSPTYTNNWDLFVVSRKPTVDFHVDGIRILSAETEDDIDRAFRLRHSEYCERLGYIQRSEDDREIDEYDAFAEYAIALDERANVIIGTIRVIHDNPKGLPIESQPEFNVRAYREEHGIDHAVEVSRLISTHNSLQVIAGVYRWVYEVLNRRDVHHILATANTSRTNHVRGYESIGFKRIGAAVPYAQLGGSLWIPLHLDIPREIENYDRNPSGYNKSVVDFILGRSDSIRQEMAKVPST